MTAMKHLAHTNGLCCFWHTQWPVFAIMIIAKVLTSNSRFKWLKSADNDGWTAPSRQTHIMINLIQENWCNSHQGNRHIEGPSNYDLKLEPPRLQGCAGCTICTSNIWTHISDTYDNLLTWQKQMDTCTFWIPHVLQTSYFAHHILDIAQFIHCIFCTPHMLDFLHHYNVSSASWHFLILEWCFAFTKSPGHIIRQMFVTHSTL